ncbi:hypothetical protein GN956_G25563 [Arapaima gigas]
MATVAVASRGQHPPTGTALVSPGGLRSVPPGPFAKAKGNSETGRKRCRKGEQEVTRRKSILEAGSRLIHTSLQGKYYLLL